MHSFETFPQMQCTERAEARDDELSPLVAQRPGFHEE